MGGSVLFPIPFSLPTFIFPQYWASAQALTQSLSFPGTRGDMNKCVSSLELYLHGSSKPRATAQAARASVKTCLAWAQGTPAGHVRRVAGGDEVGRGRASVPRPPLTRGPTRARVGGLGLAALGPTPCSVDAPARRASLCVSEAEPGTRRTFLGSRWTPLVL